MYYDFDTYLDRKNTRSFKWDKNMEYFGKEDVIPLWVADMDFQCAEPIVQALAERASHPVYGYTVRMDSAIDSFLNWMKTRYKHNFQKSWLTYSPPGVIYALQKLLHIVSEPGDSIIVQSPNYGPLFDVVTGSKRRLLLNPMIFSNGKYHLDLDHFEKLAKQGAKALILSNPNNPTGKVYTGEEILTLCKVCNEYNMWVVSDDIYGDFIFNGSTHVPVVTLGKEIENICVSCFSTSKTFNLGGLQMATIVIPNADLRNRYNREMEISQTRLDNVFGAVAMEAAYSKGGEWLDQVIDYVYDNAAFVSDYLKNNISMIRPVIPEGTFLLWLDCRELNMEPAKLLKFFIHSAGLAVSCGTEFGIESSGFVRLNLACPRAMLKKAMTNLAKALENMNC